METRHSARHQFTTLVNTPFGSQGTCFLISLALQGFTGQFIWQIHLKGLRNHGQLAQLAERLDARNDGNCNSCLPSPLDKAEIAVVVIKQLGYRIVGSCLDLPLEP